MSGKQTGDDVLTPKALAERWRIDRTEVEALVAKGLPRLECGRFNGRAADAWLQKHYSSAPPAGWAPLI